MDKKILSNAMNALTHGVYILGVRTGEKENLMTAAWLCQISSAPPMFVVAVSKTHLTAEMIQEAGYFTVSILRSSQKQEALSCGCVSGRKSDKTKLVNVEYTQNRIPMVKDAAAQLECKVLDVYDKTDHLLFIAEVTDAAYVTDDVLLYHKKEFFG